MDALRTLRSCLRLILSFVLASACLNSYANVIGAGTQNFNTTPDGLGFITVQSAETLDPGIINVGLFLNYAINSLPHWNDPDEGRLNLNDTLLSSDLNAAVGITDRLQFGMSFPAVLAQTVNDDSTTYGFFSDKGFSEVRLNSKYRFYTGKTWSSAFVATVNFNLIRNDPFSGNEPGPTYNLEWVIERKILEKILLAFNFGHRWRDSGPPTATIVTPLKNQFIASLGASYRLNSIDTKLIAELYSSFPAQQSNNQANRSASSAELIGGLKHDFTTNLALHAGAGIEIAHGVSSPDWRVYTGINYAFGPAFKNGGSISKKAKDRYIGYITFEFDSDEMAGPYKESLAALVDLLKEDGGFKHLVVEGHTDSIGNAEYNLDLSRRRAERIRRYLLENYKFKESQIAAQGLGESQPEADNSSYQGRQKNRRVEFRIER